MTASRGTDQKNNAQKNTLFTHKHEQREKLYLFKAWTETHLWRNYFDELVEEAELAHLAVKPFATTLHARLEDLPNESRCKISSSTEDFKLVIKDLEAPSMQSPKFRPRKFEMGCCKQMCSGKGGDLGRDEDSPAAPAWPPTPVATGSYGPAAWWPAGVCSTSGKKH